MKQFSYITFVFRINTHVFYKHSQYGSKNDHVCAAANHRGGDKKLEVHRTLEIIRHNSLVFVDDNPSLRIKRRVPSYTVLSICGVKAQCRASDWKLGAFLNCTDSPCLN